MKALTLIALATVLMLPKAFAQPATFTVETSEFNIPALELVSNGMVDEVVNVTLTFQTGLDDVLSFELTGASIVNVDATTDRSGFARLDLDTLALSVPVLDFVQGGSSLGQFILGMQLQAFLGTVFVFATESISEVSGS